MTKLSVMGNVDCFSTSDISRHYGISIPARFIEEVLQVKPFCKTHNGVWWKESDIDLISKQMAKHFLALV